MAMAIAHEHDAAAEREVDYRYDASCISAGGSNSNDIVYFNNAGLARLSSPAKLAGIESIQANILPHADADQLAIRQLFAKLIGAYGAGDICLHPSTAFAITFAAENIYREWSERSAMSCCGVSMKRIVVLEDQMCSAVYPWQDIIRRSKGKLCFDIVPFPTDELYSWTSLIIERLKSNDSEVLVCCLPPLHWSDGSSIDLKRISTVCHDRGIHLIVDATQAAGIIDCNVTDIRPSVMACSVHKWLRGCPGISLVYVNPDLHKSWLPLDQHGRGRDLGGDAFDTARKEMDSDGYPTIFYSDARKFDSGGKPNPVLLPILRASLEEVTSFDLNAVQLKLRTVVTPFLNWAISRGYSLPKSTLAGYHLIGIRPPSYITVQHMLDVSYRLLTSYGIVIAVRCGAFRISPYLDTTNDDVAKLIRALDLEMNTIMKHN